MQPERETAIGEQEIFALVDEALPQVYHYLLRRVGAVELAEDLTSETFLSAWASVRDRGVGDWSPPWLITIARNKLVDHWRRQAREERYLAAVGEERDPEPWPGSIEPDRVEGVLAELNPSQRAALVLRYFDGLSVPEVAALFGRSIAATDNLLARARRAFAAVYDREGGERHD